jgi:peptidoglycan hydrolase CwlO-like protein
MEGAAPTVAAVSADTVLAALQEQQRELQQAIGNLRARKDEMEPDAYESELERLLLWLARVSQTIREREGGA